MKWSVQQALGLTNEEVHAAEVRAARIEEANRPDGATEYVPETADYALHSVVGRNALRSIGVDWRKINAAS